MLFTLSSLSLFMAAVSALPATELQNTKSAFMNELMQMKLDLRTRERARGVFASNNYLDSTHATTNTSMACVNGKAGEYSCGGVDMAYFLNHETLGSITKEGNDVWGWTSDDGREFGIVGQTDGTSFVEIVENGVLRPLGRLPTTTVSAIWRDIKVIDGYAFIGSEAKGHGMQVFDLQKLLTAKVNTAWGKKSSLTAWYSAFGNSHNMVANVATKHIYAVGSGLCSGGPHIIDVSNPAKPVGKGCVSADGYTHDAQCVTYTGPDARYKNKEICFLYNEDSITIFDVTTKSTGTTPTGKMISRTKYEGSAYTHQGWLIDTANMEYLLLDDELDEMKKTSTGASQHTVTYIWEIKDLTKPKLSGLYRSPAKAIDHNQYTLNGWSYQSNYGSGLRVVDVSTVSSDPTGAGFKQQAFFDCHPEDDATNGIAEFYGSWSVYPYFKSGYILLNSIERGIFSLKLSGTALAERRRQDKALGL